MYFAQLVLIDSIPYSSQNSKSILSTFSPFFIELFIMKLFDEPLPGFEYLIDFINFSCIFNTSNATLLPVLESSPLPTFNANLHNAAKISGVEVGLLLFIVNIINISFLILTSKPIISIHKFLFEFDKIL